MGEMVAEVLQEKRMPIEEIIARVTEICRAQGVKHLSLFGSFAKGTATDRSDVDFIVYGCPDIMRLTEAVEELPTLRTIDLFDYDEVCSEELRRGMDQYGRKIF